MSNMQFKTDFERIYQMDEWTEKTFMKNKQDKWLIYKYPAGTIVINSNNGQGTATSYLSPTKSITDGDETTDFRVNWWPNNVAVAFPHDFEIYTGEEQSFKTIRMKGTGNKNYFPMNCYLKIYLAK